MNERLIAAARAVVRRWNSTARNSAQTAYLIKELWDAADALAAQPAADPACEHCGGTGEVLAHAENCHDNLCALNGDEHSCAGHVAPCSCAAQPARAGGDAPDWREQAARVMDALAENQERINAECPEHVKCYPSWEHHARWCRWHAEMFRTGKPVGSGAGAAAVLAALAAAPAPVRAGGDAPAHLGAAILNLEPQKAVPGLAASTAYDLGFHDARTAAAALAAAPQPAPAEPATPQQEVSGAHHLTDAQITGLQEVALSIFNVPGAPQETRDVIEWFIGMLRVQAEGAARAATTQVEQPAGGAVPDRCTPADAGVLCDANNKLAETEQRLRQALRFYAAKEHFSVSDDTAWDTVNGEPQNYWCDEAGTATVEDGTIAVRALQGLEIDWEGDEPPLCPCEPKWLAPSQPAVAALAAAPQPAAITVPPAWLSDQYSGEFDDMTPGQAFRKGWNDCRAAMLSAPQPAPAEHLSEDIEAMAVARYKVVHAHSSMFWSHAVVAGDGQQQLYIGRELECRNMAAKFAGAFLDGAFVAKQPAPAERPSPELAWLYSHCKAIGMTKKSDSGKWEHDIALFTIDLRQQAAEARQQPAGGAVPAIYVNAEQLAEHKDPEDAEPFGRYLPARKTRAGKFTLPLYTEAPAAVERKPLPDAECIKLLKFGQSSVEMVRRVERAHGIGIGYWRAIDGVGNVLRGEELDAAIVRRLAAGPNKEGGAA